MQVRRGSEKKASNVSSYLRYFTWKECNAIITRWWLLKVSCSFESLWEVEVAVVSVVDSSPELYKAVEHICYKVLQVRNVSYHKNGCISMLLAHMADSFLVSEIWVMEGFYDGVVWLIWWIGRGEVVYKKCLTIWTDCIATLAVCCWLMLRLWWVVQAKGCCEG